MIEIHGPYLEQFKVIIDNYKVPYIDVKILNNGKIDLILDDRFGLSEAISREEFDRWMPILANAMAIAAGYSCHGENSTPINEFKKRVYSLGSIEEKPKFSIVKNENDLIK